MLNTDDRLLLSGDLTGDEYLLLSLIALRVGKNKTAWPSNHSLCQQTKWTIKKLNREKKSLVTKGYLGVEPRYNNNAQTSNLYKIKTPYIKHYTGESKQTLPHCPNGPMAPLSNEPIPPLTIRPTPGGSKRPYEVLTTEVLINEVLTNEVSNNTTTSDSSESVSDKKVLPKVRKPKAIKTPEDIQLTEAFNLAKDFWLNEFHPGWTFGGMQAACLKKLLKKIQSKSSPDSTAEVIGANIPKDVQ
jgi:hypothetical protein